jgi:hypothetical protein
VQLDAKIRWAGSFYRYPLQFQDMIKGIPFFTLGVLLFGALCSADSQCAGALEAPKDAEEALIMLYGQPLYEFFFPRLSPIATGAFIPGNCRPLSLPPRCLD